MSHDAGLTPTHAPPDLGGGGMAALVAAVGATVAAIVLAFTPMWEGTVLRGYRDIGGVITACTGHTETAQLGRTYTRDDCQRLLASDLIKHNAGLQGCVTVAMAPHVHAALLDWAYNVGVRAACRSSLVRKLNSGNVAAACAELEQWVFVAGRDCRRPEHQRFCGGIPKRRAAERQLCEGRTL